MTLLTGLLALTQLAASPAAAATLTVDPSDASAYATIQSAIDGAASGDTITVVAGTYAECIDLGGLDLTITGADSTTTTIDGEGACDVAIVADGGETAILSGFTVHNTGAQGLSGLNSDFTLDDMVFDGLGEGLGGYYAYGGAVFLDGGSLTATNSTFTSNAAYYGGAIYVTNNGSVTLSATTIDGNSAVYGGGILLYDGTRGASSLTASNTTFSGNYASYSGGAVYADEDGAFTSSSNTYDANVSSYYGAGVYISTDGSFNSTADMFQDNEWDGTYYGYGGAVYGYIDSVLTIDQGIFSGGYASRGAHAYSYYGELTVTDSDFDAGTTSSNGASLYGYAATLAVSGSTFSNHVGGGSGTIYGYYLGEMTLESLTFTDNAVDYNGADVGWSSGFTGSLTGITSTGADASAGYGGSLYLSYAGGSVPASDLDISGATAQYGGAIYVSGDTSLALSDSVLSGNTAEYNGGAINFYAAYSSSAQTLENVELDGNEAAGGSGGGLYLTASTSYPTTLDIEALTVTDNTAYYNGGGVYASGLTTATLDSSTFDGNATTYEYYTYYGGGGMYLHTTTDFAGHDNRFCNNQSETGGALFLSSVGTDGSHTWTNSSFIENSAGYHGGLVYAYGSEGLSFTNNVFLTGDAYTDGGALYAAYTSVALTNNVVAWAVDGNGLHAYDSATDTASTVTYNAFYDNRLTDAGGYFSFSSTDDGNQSVDPLFVDYTADGDCTNDDLRLSSTSTLRDAGDPSILDPDGSVSDIGVYGGPGSSVFDMDGDGFDNVDDCDDDEASTYPGAPDTWYDGVDSDCDGADDYDQDGDGFSSDEHGGTDCDDADEAINPDAEDIPDDGIDQDCDGSDATESGDDGTDDGGGDGGGDGTGDGTGDGGGDGTGDGGGDDDDGGSSDGGGDDGGSDGGTGSDAGDEDTSEADDVTELGGANGDEKVSGCSHVRGGDLAGGLVVALLALIAPRRRRQPRALR